MFVLTERAGAQVVTSNAKVVIYMTFKAHRNVPKGLLG